MGLQGIQRREILRVMAAAAAAASFPGFTRWAFAYSHPSRGIEQIRPAQYQPQFFTPSEYTLVSKLTELIIPGDQTPGAKEAGVAEFVDFMVFHDSARQFKLRMGLTWLNAHSERLFDKPFVECKDEQQISILEPLAYKAKHRPGEEDGREMFETVKELTTMGFYTSEIGYKELDNPALKYYSGSPACPHTDDPEHKHLPSPKW